jgi:hypothetical protein
VNKNKMVIKGSSYPFIKGFWLSCSTGIGTLICLYKLIDTDVPWNSEKYEELVLATIGFIILTAFFYWLLSTDYYYYEIKPDKIIVRNFIRPFYQELPLSTLLYVNLHGDINRPRWMSIRSCCLEFIYQYNDESKNYQYFSINYDMKDWIMLIGGLKKLNVRIEDPNKSFFKNSDIKFEDL